MSLVSVGTNTQTVTVATEVALAVSPLNLANIQSGPVLIFGTVNCATGTGGTITALKVRQGTSTAGTQVGATLTGDTKTANMARTEAFSVIDYAPSATGGGQYVVTLTFTGNSSSVVVSNIAVVDIDSVLG